MLIEAAAALVIAGYCTAAFWSLLRRFDRCQAQSLVAEGALNALGFILCGTLLKTLLLKSWSQIGMFACVLALRTLLKRIFLAEQTRCGVRTAVQDRRSDGHPFPSARPGDSSQSLPAPRHSPLR